MRFLRTNTAVIITVGPFYDRTDGVTIETALTITNERITLTADTDDGSAPTNILDNIAGATSGTSNDLNYITGNDAGMMQLELSAANVNRLGRMFLSITDAANHVPVFHEFMVVPALVYDTYFASTGGATFPAATLASTTNITAAAGCAVTSIGNNVITAASINADAITDAKVAADVTIASVTGAVGSVTGAVGSVTGAVGSVTAGVTVTTNNDKTGYGLSAAAVQAIWDALTTALTTVGSVGKKLADWTIGTAQTGDSFARLGAPAGASVSADIAAAKADTAAIKAKTDNLPAAPAAVGDIPTAAQNATAVLTTAMTESYRADGATGTLAQMQYEIVGHLGESSIAGTTKTVNKIDGITAAATFTLDDATTPTSITRAT